MTPRARNTTSTPPPRRRCGRLNTRISPPCAACGLFLLLILLQLCLRCVVCDILCMSGKFEGPKIKGGIHQCELLSVAFTYFYAFTFGNMNSYMHTLHKLHSNIKTHDCIHVSKTNALFLPSFESCTLPAHIAYTVYTYTCGSIWIHVYIYAFS